jgi:hypothetical protein
MGRGRLSPALLLGALAVACREPAPLRPPAPPAPVACPERAPPPARQLTAPAYDVAVTPAGTYVVALGAGVQELDPCTLDGLSGCQDLAEARTLALRADGTVANYRHREGGLVACSLRTGLVGAADPDARGRIEGNPRAEDGALTATIDTGAASLRGPQRAMALPGYDEAVDVDVDARRSLAAVCDRSGAVTLWSTRTGAALVRWPGRPRVACAIALDRARGRLVTVCDDGRIEVRAVPEG